MGPEEAERLIARLREQAREIHRLASGLPENQLAQRLEAGQWSLKELVCHIWRVQQIFELRIQSMLAEDNPEIAVYEPDGDPEFERLAARPMADLLTGFSNDRQRFLKLLETIDASGWQRTGIHPEFPRYDVGFQLQYMAHHEAHHIYQMFQRRALLEAPRY